jgi:hypothetical protein
MIGELPEALGVAAVDGEPGPETHERPLLLARQERHEGLARPAERRERDAEPEHAVREE